MSLPLFIASGQQAVADFIGWYVVLPIALVFSLVSCWCTFKRWKVAAIVMSLLSFPLTALLVVDNPIWAGWIPAYFGLLGFGGGFLLKLPAKKEEEANQIAQPKSHGVADC